MMKQNQAEAVNWLKRVKGELMHNPESPRGPESWVAIVRTPPAPGKRGKLILGFGESAEEAATVAEQQWKTIWSGLSSVH